MQILLVQPTYYTRYPPLGLLKISTFHKKQGDIVHYQRGCSEAPFYPDKIYITSLFTWAWKSVHDTVAFYKANYQKSDVILGGIYASMMPKHASLSGAQIFTGVFNEVENLLPDYSLVPDWDSSIVFSSRGCINDCPFCAVPKLEPKFECKKSIRNLIYPGHKKIILWDNNLLASPYWKEILNEIKELNLTVDFNQGIDLRLMTEEKAHIIHSMKKNLVRVAFDNLNEIDEIERGITLLKNAGVRGKKILCYLLYNYHETPDDFHLRLQKCMEWGVASYPMRYQPVRGHFALKKDSFVGPYWNLELLEMIADARRVLGRNGAFPPYTGLVEKFLDANNLFDALKLWPKKNS